MKSYQNYQCKGISCVIIAINILLVLRNNIILAKECESIEIRDNPWELEKLRDCSVIKGYLQIISLTSSTENYSNYSYPELREITEYLFLHEIPGLTTLATLFPHLVVIRGINLYENYALILHELADLSSIGLKSLISIQRGSIYINQCPSLCYLNAIDWNKLIRQPFEKNIKVKENSFCPTFHSCRGCKNNTCWTSRACQKSEKDNLLNLIGEYNCSSLCLGGCLNSKTYSDPKCNVCKGITNDGVCVEKCPNNTYLYEEHLRCYDLNACYKIGLLKFKDKCVKECPTGYSTDISNSECFLCNKNCFKICNGQSVIHLSQAKLLKGCTHINGSLEIKIKYHVKEDIFDEYFSNIEEIDGYLKIYKMTSPNSLNFLSGLKSINGKELLFKQFAFVIAENENLEKLWDWYDKDKEKIINMTNGGIFVQSNYKLCLSEIYELQNHILHNKSLDIFHENEIKTTCNKVILDTYSELISFENVTIYWWKLSTSQIEDNFTVFILFYREVPEKEYVGGYVDDQICTKSLWFKEVLFPRDLSVSNKSSWSFNVSGLQQNTKYVYYIKTSIGIDNMLSYAQSNMSYFNTLPDIPTLPIVSTVLKTSNSITLEWRQAQKIKKELISYYGIEIYMQPDKKDFLDQRDYCKLPIQEVGYYNKDINCCKSTYSQVEENEFIIELNKKYHCIGNYDERCTEVRSRYFPKHLIRLQNNETLNHPKTFTREIKSLKFIQYLSIKNTNYTIKNLNHFTSYIFLVFACNIFECSAYYMHTERTLKIDEMDDVELKITKLNDSKKVYLDFHEPRNANGVITSYTISYRKIIGDFYNGQLICITRKEHEIAKYRYILSLGYGKYEIRVRSVSLSGPGKFTNWQLVKIEETSRSGVIATSIILTGSLMALGFYTLKRKFPYIRLWRRSDQSEVLLSTMYYYPGED